MAKIVLEDTNGGYNIASINRNFQKIQAELNNKVLYRLNDVPFESNAWLSNMDANGRHIYNLPTPTFPNEAARLQDVQQAISGLPSANLVPFSPYGIAVSTNVQGAIQNVVDNLSTLVSKTNLASALGSSLVGYLNEGTPTTVEDALDILYYGVANILNTKYAGGAIAGTDCTAAIQAAIDDKKFIDIPEGEYYAGNLLMRSGIRIEGRSHSSIIKLLPNATVTSINGSIADSSGFYPGNVFCSTLNHNGGVWSDGGTRALDENNSTYIMQDIIIRNLTIDGNKANNQIGDLGQNRSAMGAGVSIHQCKNVTIENCKLLNHRLDGIHIGYTLHGGSDYCNILNNHFEGNQRTNIAMITGKYNGVHGNTGTEPTGGTGVGGGSALDIEANFAGEVNYRHTVTGNRLGGRLGIVSQNVAKLQGTTCSGNVWLGGLAISGSEMTGGVTISGDTFIANGVGQDWITRFGSNVSNVNDPQTSISDCTATGYRRVMGALAGGQHANLKVSGCTINAEAFGLLVRGYKINFISNTFTFSGNADAATLDMSNTLGGTVTNQGRIRFSGNKFYGVSCPIFIRMSRDSTWPFAANDFVFDKRNEFGLTGHTTFLSTVGSVTLDDNLIENFTPISISTLNFFRMTMNEVRATSAQNMFSGQTGGLNDNEISDNDLFLISPNVSRPKDTTICKNRIVDGNIQIVYSFTASGVGRNHVAGNTLTAKTLTIATPFSVTTGGSFLATDFVANDQYKYNTFVGYTGAPSIAAGISGHYDGTFV